MNPDLQKQLQLVEPSTVNGVSYYPCRVKLRDGETLDRVYLVQKDAYLKDWGVPPQRDKSKALVDIDKIVSIENSPARLPAKFANRLYASGESGMGYVVFVVQFAGGKQQAYISGNAVDFIIYPPNTSPEDIEEVIPHQGKDDNPEHSPSYLWCLYS